MNVPIWPLTLGRSTRLAIVGLLTAVVGASNVAFPADETAQSGFEIFRDNCQACHLETGWGIPALEAPSIAALPRWYVSSQLREFRSGHRSAAPEDEKGKLMASIAIRLSEREIAFVGKYIEGLAPNPQRMTSPAHDPARGETIYHDRCARCHGQNAEGNRRDRIAPLNIQPDWYLINQMEKFEKGIRVHSAKQKIVLDAQSEAGDIAAYLASIKPPQ